MRPWSEALERRHQARAAAVSARFGAIVPGFCRGRWHRDGHRDAWRSLRRGTSRMSLCSYAPELPKLQACGYGVQPREASS